MIQHNFKKKLGQNFLTDTNLLSGIVRDAGIGEEDIVLEIGAGAGTLTRQLSLAAKKVVSFEIDKELEPLLLSEFKDTQNVEIVFSDFLEASEDKIRELVGENFKVVANLPYYITTKIITKLFSLSFAPKTIVAMVQKEVGERIVATERDSEYGYFSAYISSVSFAKITRNVSRKMFTPAPKVDSCVIRLDKKPDKIEDAFVTFLKSAFQMKRKTLSNNLSSSYKISKREVEETLEALELDKNARADALSAKNLLVIYNALKNKLSKNG